MTKRALLALAIFTIVAVPVHADFNAIARAISAQRGVKRVWIPFLGLARVAVRMVSPSGVHDFQLATFEGGRALDARELQSLMAKKVGKGYKPLVQVRSRNGEWSFIYAKPAKSGTRLDLIVLANDGDETTLVRVDVDAAVAARELGTPRHVSRNVTRNVAHASR